MTAKHLQPSFLGSVENVLDLVQRAELSEDSANSAAQAAIRAIPARRPQARLFMAWEVYYRNPDARRMTLEAMCGL